MADFWNGFLMARPWYLLSRNHEIVPKLGHCNFVENYFDSGDDFWQQCLHYLCRDGLNFHTRTRRLAPWVAWK